MAQRVLIQSGVTSSMRVSMPGFDAATAALDNMCFDSRWSGLEVYRRAVTLDAGPGTNTHFFGETLDAPPLLFGHFQTLVSGVPSAIYANSFFMFRGGGTDNWFYAEVGTSYVQFNVSFGSQAARLKFSLFRRPTG